MAILWLTAAAGFGATIPLDPAKTVKRNVKVESATYKGQTGVRVTYIDGDESIARIQGTEFQDGVIEVDVVGDVLPGATGGARGFVGIAFRATDSKYECFYLRPTNGRAEDQERRNHATQYVSVPGYPWERLRKETPSKYESYADMLPGEWIHLKIEVKGNKARLYVNGAAQPALIVNDLKQGVTKGGIALWVGPGTVAHFANLKTTP